MTSLPRGSKGDALMAYLIFQRIQDSSEQALELLRDQLSSLNISKLPGEDVEQAVSLVKSTYKVLKCASSKNRTYLPNDFAKTVFHLFQTTSVPDFNEIFHTQYVSIQTQADLHGTQPRWPAVTSIISLATNTYRRLKHAGVWDKAVGKPSGAYVSHSPRLPPTDMPTTRPARTCWNCGSTDHMCTDCPAPKDQAKIDAARQRFLATKRARGKPKRKTGPDGKPMILNKKGYYVLDQKLWRERQSTATPGLATPSPTPTPQPTVSQPSAQVAQATAICSALTRTTRYST